MGPAEDIGGAPAYKRGPVLPAPSVKPLFDCRLRLAVRWIPPARIQHPWPTKRFEITIQGKSPVR